MYTISKLNGHVLTATRLSLKSTHTIEQYAAMEGAVGEVCCPQYHTSYVVLTHFIAVAYGYFEALIHHGDSDRFAMEEARLRSMTNTMIEAGFQEPLFEDFINETCDLLRKVTGAMPLGTAEDVLWETFNESMLQEYIITHIRVRPVLFGLCFGDCN